MSVTHATAVRPEVAKRRASLAQVFSTCCYEIARYFARRAAIKHLHELNDRALRDIGIERAQIDSAVRDFIIDPERRRMR